MLFIMIFERYDGLVLLGFSLFEPCQSGNTAAIRKAGECRQIARPSEEIINGGVGFVRGRKVITFS